jgi:hypothetical protein
LSLSRQSHSLRFLGCRLSSVRAKECTQG